MAETINCATGTFLGVMAGDAMAHRRFLAGAFFAVLFLAAVFLPLLFFAEPFFAGLFFARLFFTEPFFADVFLVGAFFAAFLGADRLEEAADPFFEAAATFLLAGFLPLWAAVWGLTNLLKLLLAPSAVSSW